MSRDPEITKAFKNLRNARREVVKATERAAEVHDQIGLLPGHLAEILRRLNTVRDEADRAIRTFSDKQAQ